MLGMFQNAASFNTAIPTSGAKWDVSNVTNMNAMFLGSPFNQDLSSWDVSKVTNMSYMFYNVTEFNQDISGWDVNQVTTFTNFLFDNTDLSTANYNKLLHNWHADDPVDSLTFHGGDATTDSSSGGVDGTAARAALVLATGSGGDGWTITDGD